MSRPNRLPPSFHVSASMPSIPAIPAMPVAQSFNRRPLEIPKFSPIILFAPHRREFWDQHYQNNFPNMV